MNTQSDHRIWWIRLWGGSKTQHQGRENPYFEMVRRKNRRKPITKRHIKTPPCFNKTRSRFGTHYHYEERSSLMEKDSLNSRVKSKILLLLGCVSLSLSPSFFCITIFLSSYFRTDQNKTTKKDHNSIKSSATPLFLTIRAIINC